MVENEDILKAINALSTKVETYHGDFREFRGGTVERLENLEDDAKDARKWENVKVFAILPVVTALHMLANKIGIRV